MKIDKRLSEEFNTPLPPPMPRLLYQVWDAEHVIGFILGNAISFMFGAAMLGVGAWVGPRFPSAIYWFFGASGFVLLLVVVIFALSLIAMTADIPEEPLD